MVKRNYSLDFLKFLCCIGIMWMHYRENTCPDGIWFGNVLVNKDTSYPYIDRIKNGMKFKEYIIPRVIRIVPMLTLCTIYLEIKYSLMRASGHSHGLILDQPNLFGIILASLGVQNGWGFVSAEIFEQAWYLDVLLLCYVIYYICVYIAGRIKIDEKVMFAFMIIIGTVCISTFSEFPFLTLYDGRGYVLFFIGLILADILNKKGTTHGLIVYAGMVLTLFTVFHIFWPHFLVFWRLFLISFFCSTFFGDTG